MVQNGGESRVEELEDLVKYAVLEKEKNGRMEVSLTSSIKLGFGLAFGFWIFHMILLMFLLLLILALEISIPVLP